MIPITEPPVVEIDTAATAAYIKLRSGKVARTEPFGSQDGLVMLDFDDAGNVLGIEVVGLVEFGIRELVGNLSKDARVEVSDDVLNQTRYVAATA